MKIINKESLKRLWPAILYIIGGVVLLYVLIWIFTFKPQLPLQYKHALDSLNRANSELVAKQKQIDTLLGSYQSQLRSLDAEVKILENRKTEINNYYGNMGRKAGKYTPTQIDSFFKARYNY